MKIDKKCLNILVKYSKGLATEAECKKVIDEHGDEIASEILKNGFTSTYICPSTPNINNT